jgi:Ser/Thr protein kinase RdoA (MazF antagonist)
LEAGLRAVLPAWGMNETANLRLLTFSENATFLADDNFGGKLVFRVHRPDYNTEQEIRAELAWTEALRQDGVVTTPRSIPAIDGRKLVAFRDGQTERFVVAFEFMPGKEPDIKTGLTRWFGVLGEITARLHVHSRNWVRPENFVRKTWSFDTIIGPNAQWGDWRHTPGLDAAGVAVLERVQALLERQTAAYGYAPERFGLVHCDLRPANLLVEGDRMAVIDFDDCGLSWYIFDFATAISFMEHESFVPALMRAWVDGYRQVVQLSTADEAALPIFVMLRRMQLTAWIGSHGETPTAKMMSDDYVRGTVALAAQYLRAHELEAM